MRMALPVSRMMPTIDTRVMMYQFSLAQLACKIIRAKVKDVVSACYSSKTGI
jgi:hypothetical protein